MFNEEEKFEKEEKREKKKGKKKLIIVTAVTGVFIISLISALSSGSVSTGKYRTEEEITANPVLEEKKEDEVIKSTEGDVAVIENAILNVKNAKSYRFTYSINGFYNEERNIMDNVIAGKYSEDVGYMKQFTTNNKEQISYNIMRDLVDGEDYFQRSEIITKIHSGLAKGITENYEWVNLRKDEISDKNIISTNLDYEGKLSLLKEFDDKKVFMQQLAEQDLAENISKVYTYKTDEQDVIKIREKMLFLNEEQNYIDLYEVDEIVFTYKIDANGNLVSERYDVKMIKNTGQYKFVFEKKYSNFNEVMEFTEKLNESNKVNRGMIETIKKQNQ